MWRIKDWNKNFETAQSRSYDRIKWVPFPNKHDGDGFTQLIEHEHGVMHYGAWALLVQVASKCKPRGTLVREGNKPHTAESLGRMTRVAPRIYREAIPRFMEIGWLEEVTDSVLSDGYQSTIPDRTGPDRKGKEKQYRPAGKAGGFSEKWDSENWQTARRMHVEAANKLWPKRDWGRVPMKSEDRELLLKLAYLAVTRLSSDWWQTALAETLAGNPRKPLGYFKACLRKKPQRDGLDLNALLDEVKVPAIPLEAVGRKP